MSEIEKFWDKSADNYDKTEKRFEIIHSRSRKNAKRHVKDTDVVLDYGCGTGTTSCELSRHVKVIEAIDISSKMIEIAKGKAVFGKVENVTFLQGDIFDRRYKNESFHVILAFNMLHTVPDSQRVVQRTYDLLKPGGTFIFATPCLREKMSLLVSLQIFLVRVLLRVRIIPIPIRRLKRSDLDDLVDDRFQIVESENIYADATSYFLVAKKNLA
jgi:2-polyprenyl-3-methyl-5-hydroxy-6-metoxy-1,4-benzoquinol methylase